MQKIIEILQSADLLLIIASISCCLFVAMLRGMNSKEKFIAFTIILYSVVEITAYIMAQFQIYNQWLYSLSLLPQLVLVVGILTHNLQNKLLKKTLVAVGILILISHVINMIAGQGYGVLCTYTYIPACVLMALCAFCYLREQFEHAVNSPFESLPTWFALALLIDNAGTIPILATLSWPELYTTRSLMFLWNIVKYLYISWFLINITGLLWTKTSLKSVFYSR
jgi:hypothetical protein